VDLGVEEKTKELLGMAIPPTVLSRDKGLSDWAILGGYVGSISHGTYVSPKVHGGIDDKDVMFVCVPPPAYYLGLMEYGSRGTKEVKEAPWDIVVYEARKAVRLLAQGNPNMLALLWLPRRSYVCVAPAGEILLNAREIFVGRHVYRAFVGYARAQLHRMTHGAHLGYMGEKRKALVQQFGYDTKNASHLIRLLRMAVEFLKDGELFVERAQDATELIDIKMGRWTLDRVQVEADRLFALADGAYLASSLPAKPDSNRVSKLAEEIVASAWLWRNEMPKDNKRAEELDASPGGHKV